MKNAGSYGCIVDALCFLGVKSDSYTKYLYDSYPLFESFRAISYTLSQYGVETTLIEASYDEVKSIPYPFIIKQSIGYKFVCDFDSYIKEAWLNGIHGNESVKILVINTEIKNKRPIGRKEYYFNKILGAIGLFGLLLVSCLNVGWGSVSSISYIYLCTSAIGLLLTILFQIYSLDRGNPLVNRICSSNKHNSRKDCSSILDSSASLFANVVSWADIGLMFFMYVISMLLFYNEDGINIIALIYILSLMYVIYSLYYQFVVKKYCALCLAVMAVLVLNALVSVIYLSQHRFSISDFPFMSASLIGIGVCSFTYTLKRYITEYLILKRLNRVYKSVKSDYRILRLMQNDSEINICNDKVGLTINPDAETRLTIIFNPACSPCIRKLRTLLKILKNKQNVCISFIIFFDLSDEISWHNANMLISSYLTNKTHFLDSLENYVNSYPRQSANYNNSKDATQIIYQHHEWCMKNNVTSTPTILMNGLELPSIYTYEDLDYLLN